MLAPSDNYTVVSLNSLSILHMAKSAHGILHSMMITKLSRNHCNDVLLCSADVLPVRFTDLAWLVESDTFMKYNSLVEAL